MRYVYYKETYVYRPNKQEPEKEPDIAEIIGGFLGLLIVFFVFCGIVKGCT